MVYIMSDIHGQYKAFMEMIEKIKFTENDMLYILGDIIDRGPEPFQIYEYIISHKNVNLLMGNHEKMMIDSLGQSIKGMAFIEIWYYNGGYITHKEFRKLPREKRNEILEYFKGLPYYYIINKNGKKFILCHAGLKINKSKSIEENIENSIKNDDILWLRPSSDKVDGYTIIHGHTPTGYIYNDFKIYISPDEKEINTDCGCAGDVRLGCLRLDDMKEYYVNIY